VVIEFSDEAHATRAKNKSLRWWFTAGGDLSGSPAEPADTVRIGLVASLRLRGALGFGPERLIPDEQRLDGLGGQRAREQEALGMRAPEPFEFPRLRRIFNAFGNHTGLEGAGEREDAFNDRRAIVKEQASTCHCQPTVIDRSSAMTPGSLATSRR
jgi:hypothetical protein